ncbi:hypothetical protein [Burkholderia multivorans]|nr:hypothetical protein [Burkholderia multivorans]
MTTSHNAGYRLMIGYIQPSAVQRLDLGIPETIFPVRSASGSVPVYIDPSRTVDAMGRRATWDSVRNALAIAMCAFASRPDRHDLNAAVGVIDALTEPGLPLAWLRSVGADSAND